MDTIENETKVWGFTLQGNTLHAFIGGPAMCRKNITTPLKERCDLDMARQMADEAHMGFKVCKGCEKKYLAMVARAEASVQSVNPYDQVCEGVVTVAGAARAAGNDEPETSSSLKDVSDSHPCSDCCALKPVAYHNYRGEPFCADCVKLHDEPAFSFEPGWAVLEHGRDEHRIDISEVSSDPATGELSGPYRALHELHQCGLAEIRGGGLYWVVSPEQMACTQSDDPVEQALAGITETGQRIVTVDGVRYAVSPIRYGRIWTGSDWRNGRYLTYWTVVGRKRVSGPRVADVFGFSGPDGLFAAASRD